MRMVSLFKKTMIESFRDWKIMVMTLTFAPFFVFLMYFYYADATTTYRIVVLNHDEGAAGQELVSRLSDVRSSGETQILRVRQAYDLESAQEHIRDRSADLVVEIPTNFSGALLDFAQGRESVPVAVRTYGDQANGKYLMAAAFCDYLTYEYAAAMTGQTGPVRLEPVSIGSVQSPDEFDLYVPALLALALMMLMFTAAGSVIKEKDNGTLVRLRLSHMTTFEWLSAISVAQVVIGVAAVGLTFLTAAVLGYRSSGSLPAVAVVCLVSSMSIVAISMVVAASLRTIFDLVTIGSFPFFILMFFSGGMFPLPDLRLLTIGSRTINVNDILPTTHSISALDRILNAGGSLGDVAFEIGAIVALTVLFFTIGTWAFTRRHMRAA